MTPEPIVTVVVLAVVAPGDPGELEQAEARSTRVAATATPALADRRWARCPLPLPSMFMLVGLLPLMSGYCSAVWAAGDAGAGSFRGRRAGQATMTAIGAR